MTTYSITRDQIHTLRGGDRITHIDGSPADYTVTRPLDFIRPGSSVQAVTLARPGRTEPVNLYPDTHMADSITIERDDIRIAAADRRNLTNIAAGDRLIVRSGDTQLLPTRRVTGVETVTVLSNNIGGGWRCRTVVTTGGTIIAGAAVVYGIA
jgi:hypothetical protein